MDFIPERSEIQIEKIDARNDKVLKAMIKDLGVRKLIPGLQKDNARQGGQQRRTRDWTLLSLSETPQWTQRSPCQQLSSVFTLARLIGCKAWLTAMLSYSLTDLPTSIIVSLSMPLPLYLRNFAIISPNFSLIVSSSLIFSEKKTLSFLLN